MEELYKIIHNFKIDKKFWLTDSLSSEDYDTRRSKPAPYVKTAIKIGKLLGLKNVVEIGSTRLAVSQKCLDFFDKENEAFISPPCCTDGHCGFFFADHGFEVYTVDIDENCKTQIIWSYENIKRDFPDNVHMEIPKEGIQYLKDFNGKIDILVLDGWDKGTPEYAEKHLEAYLAAKDKLSDVHLILIDDTDYLTKDGGKDAILSPHLLKNGYIPLFNGRQTLFLNTTNITIHEVDYKFKKEKEEFVIDNDMDFELTEFPKVILSLTTTPNRLHETRDGWGVKSVIKKLLTLSYVNYEIHFNIPYINHKTSEEYIIPDWLDSYAKSDERLKLFRCNDYGSITKIVPTLLRVKDPEAIIITVDDDIVYMDGFIEYHLKKQQKYPEAVLGFAGIGALDGTCHLCTTLQKDTQVKIIEGYKTVSYKRKFFTDDFFTEFVGKSWCDDLLISAHMGKNKIPRIVMNYYKDTDYSSRVESFPIVSVVPNENSGCYLYRIDNVDKNDNEFYNKGYL
jgi:hypothetical protein